MTRFAYLVASILAAGFAFFLGWRVGWERAFWAGSDDELASVDEVQALRDELAESPLPGARYAVAVVDRRFPWVEVTDR